MTKSTRHSTRQKRPSQKLTDHIAWTDDLLVESDQVPASGSVSSDDAIEEEDEEPENVESDFEQTLEINGDQNEDDEDEDEDEIASDEGESFHDSPDNGDDGEYDLEEEDEGPYAHDYDEDDLLVPVLKMKGDRLPILDENMPSAAKHPRGFHSRGLYPRAKMYNRDNNLKWMYGECEDELIPIVIVKHKWMDQPTLPTANQDEEGRGGMSMPLYYTEERKREDTEEFCAWYRDRGGGKVMDQAQQMEAVDEETAKEYFPPAWPEHEVLMGPLNNQQRHKVGLRESVPLTEASSTTSQDRPAEQSNQNGELNQDPGYLQNQGHEHDVSERRESLHSQDQDLALSEVGRIEPQETQEQENTVQPRKRGRKPKNPKKSNVMVGVCNGFILNLGSKICSMDWAPTSDQGTSQYLAVCQVIKPPSSHEHTSPFVPTLPYKSSIQIWEFKTIQRDEGKPYRTIDASQAPRLIHVICTEWGFGQEVRWCPFYQPPDELYEDEEDGKKHIGVLAVIFSDGHLRVLNISIDTRRNARAKVYVKYNSSAITFRPPKTIPACMAWLSPSDIVVGCANGFVSIYTLPPILFSSSTPSQKDTIPPLPDFHISIHHTYILNIITTFPTDPAYIITTSVDGYTTLCSPLHSHSDTVSTLRTREYNGAVSYNPHLQCVNVIEEQYNISTGLLRRFFTVNNVARVESLILSTDSATCHTSTLIGGADGSVTAFSPLRKLFSYRNAGKVWQQIWFKHEFVREEDVWVDMKIAAKVAGREYGDGGALRRTGDIGGKKKKKKKRDEAVEMDVDEEEEVDDDAMDTDPPQDQSSPPPADLSSSTPQRPKHTPQPPPSSSSHSQLPRKGTSRILHPGRTYQALLDPVGDVSRKESKKSRFKKGKSKKGDLPAQTIHEEETGVNVLRWNGNVECGAWAAAATGCGLVVVEDCGI